jgi:carboxyl-terminal processing protease
MPKRNLVWILAVILLLLLFWGWPDTVQQHRDFYKVFAPLVEIRDQIHRSYVEEVDDTKLMRDAIQGMVQRLDPYSKYIPPEQMDSFEQQTTGNIQGIGIFLDDRPGFLTVQSPLEDSPAFKAGILAGDQILRIDGESTKNMAIEDAVRKLSGPSGSTVTVEVRHAATSQIEVIKLVRNTLHIYSVKGFARKPDGTWDYMIDLRNRIGYIRITSFLTHTTQELDQAYDRLQQQGVRALILDLRGNPGGLLDIGVDVADRFLRDGVIVTTRGRYKQEQEWKATPDNTYKPVPMVVLVNELSASASEIVSGALKDHKRARIIGVRTYGKGCVQKVIPLGKDLGQIKITTDYYYLPSGRNIHRRPNAKVWGVDPDVTIALTPAEQEKIEESRRDADILCGETASGPTSRRTCQPKSLIIDRQLAAALKFLRDGAGKGRPATGPAMPPAKAPSLAQG